MKHADILKLYKTPTIASMMLGVTLQTLRNWKTSIPHRSQQWIEAHTEGALRADRNGRRK